jgi:hypothetical protein
MGTIGKLNNLGNIGETRKVNNGREVLIPITILSGLHLRKS